MELPEPPPFGVGRWYVLHAHGCLRKRKNLAVAVVGRVHPCILKHDLLESKPKSTYGLNVGMTPQQWEHRQENGSFRLRPEKRCIVGGAELKFQFARPLAPRQ